MGILGRIQTGSASKFSSAVNPPITNDTDPNVSNVQIASPPAPRAYQGLRTGPDFELEYEPNITPPIDSSMRFLRTLSPFMIQVEPPQVIASSPASSNSGSQNGPRTNPAGIYAAARMGNRNPFATARSAIQASTAGGGLQGTGQSVDEYIAAGRRNSKTGDGTRTTNLRGEGPGRIGTPAIADVQTAVDIQLQLKAIVETPPLVMLINPQSLNMVYTKIQQFGDRSRFGYVFQAWGEEQPRLSISAKCGAFISGNRGVQWASRRDSAAWQNLMTAFHFYRHNGYIHDTVGKSNAHHLVGALSIHYDQWVYYGNMESFSYSLDDTSTQLGGVVFEMQFVVSAMFDTAKQPLVVLPLKSPVPSPSDPRYQGQGQRAFNRPNTLSVGLDGNIRGQENFLSLNDPANGITPGGGSRVPATTAVLVNNQGFQPSPIAVTAPVPVGTVRTTPFGFGRR